MENRIFDRKAKQVRQVPVVADRWLKTLYQTLPGQAATWLFVKRKWLSALYGRYARTKRSKKAADSIIEMYGLDMSLFLPYQSYYEFFTRKLDSIRMPESPYLGAVAECFLSAYDDIDIGGLFCVKGESMRLGEILQDEQQAMLYTGGTLFRFRLAPHHYHHLHHFDDATICSIRDIRGGYYSVNPVAQSIVKLYCKNKRRVVTMKTRRFGTVVLVEVGATMIGSIINPFKEGDEVRIGEDGGYFAPGGSMLLLLFEKGAVKACEDILWQTREGLETMVALGEIIGKGE